jgi:hypothetical protein
VPERTGGAKAFAFPNLWKIGTAAKKTVEIRVIHRGFLYIPRLFKRFP